MKQIEKNRHRLLEEIEKLSNQPITDAIAAELSVYKSALDAIDMICDEDKEERNTPATRFYSSENGYSTATAENVTPMTRELAEEWVSNMENADGTRGGHWSMEQSEQIRKQHGFDCDPIKFWVTINMMYSDYCAAAKKNGCNTVDFYADMAHAFLDDKDAQPNKLARYRQYVAGVGASNHTARRLGNSEFLEIVSEKDQAAAWEIIDGHMRRMKEINPRVYKILIDKLREL